MHKAIIASNYREFIIVTGTSGYFIPICDFAARQQKNSTPISKWETMLGDPFIRIHRAFLVNKNYIESRIWRSIVVNGTELPVSRTYADKIKPHLPQNETADEATASM